jgi:hypothetical protein
MPQKRSYNYDSNADAASENTISAVLHPKGVYQGMDLTVTSSGGLTLAVGYGLQYNGVLWYESTAVTIPFTPPSSNTDYTLVAQHDNRQIFGGVAVTYDLVSDALLSDIPDGVVLGWVYYRSGGGPLLQSQVVSAPKQASVTLANQMVVRQPVELIPAYPRSILTSSGLDITFTPLAFDAGSFVLYQGVANSPMGAGIEQAIQQLQLYGVAGVRPYSITFYRYCNAPAATNLQVEVYGTDLLPVTVTGSPIVGAGPTWGDQTVYIDRTAGQFAAGLPYTIRLTFNVDLGKDFRLGRIVVSFWPYPSTP